MEQWILERDECFRYQLLDRLRADCDYYLNYGRRCTKHLWADNAREQIAAMKLLWNSFPEGEKPEWLTWEQLLEYEDKMCAV